MSRFPIHPIEYFFDRAEQFIISRGYQWEIDLVQNRYFEDIDSKKLAWEFLFCALGSSGLNNKVVQKQYDNFILLNDSGKNAFDAIPNKRIREAIIYVFSHNDGILESLRLKTTDEEKIKYIQTLPQMGPKTSYHFARNIGMDCIKPDIWITRIADHYGYYKPIDACLQIQQYRPEYRIGTIDLIFWRYCNLTGSLT